jgi:hypothetical protein
VIISGDQWLRVGLRAELRERGYDAVGARDVPEALRYDGPNSDRGPVALILVDQDALGDDVSSAMLKRVLVRLGQPPVALIAPGNRPPAEGEWAAMLRRPIAVGDIVEFVRQRLPDAHADVPLDD